MRHGGLPVVARMPRCRKGAGGLRAGRALATVNGQAAVVHSRGAGAVRELRVGAVGCGARGRHVMARLQALGRTRITALYDPGPGTAERVRAELAAEAEVVAGYREVVERDDVDLVLVCSPDHAHREPAVAAFEHGKHVFCEKPMATTVADCQAIWDAARAADRHLFVGFVLRYAPFYLGIKARIDGGDLGRVVSIEANENLSATQGAFFHRDWRRFRKFTGSYLLEKCCHDLGHPHLVRRRATAPRGVVRRPGGVHAAPGGAAFTAATATWTARIGCAWSIRRRNPLRVPRSR